MMACSGEANQVCCPAGMLLATVEGSRNRGSGRHTWYPHGDTVLGYCASKSSSQRQSQPIRPRKVSVQCKSRDLVTDKPCSASSVINSMQGTPLPPPTEHPNGRGAQASLIVGFVYACFCMRTRERKDDVARRDSSLFL